MESDIQKKVKKGEGSKSPSSKSVEEIAKNIEDKVSRKVSHPEVINIFFSLNSAEHEI